MVSPALGAVAWTHNGDYLTDDRQPGGTPEYATLSGIINPDKNTYWLNLSPIQSGTIGNFGVIGTTNLPPGTNLSLDVYSTVFHPSYPHYDWSHERAEGDGKVFRSGNAALFSGSINTSRLYPGEYYLVISTTDSKEEASVSETIDLIPVVPATPGRMHSINVSQLRIPPLHTFSSIRPEINSWWKIVEGKRVRPGDVTYGSVIYCAWDGVCRVYDRDGIQYYAAYDGKSITEVPSNSCISFGNNILTISLDGCNNNIVLTKIYEHMWDWE